MFLVTKGQIDLFSDQITDHRSQIIIVFHTAKASKLDIIKQKYLQYVSPSFQYIHAKQFPEIVIAKVTVGE